MKIFGIIGGNKILYVINGEKTRVASGFESVLPLIGVESNERYRATTRLSDLRDFFSGTRVVRSNDAYYLLLWCGGNISRDS